MWRRRVRDVSIELGDPMPKTSIQQKLSWFAVLALTACGGGGGGSAADQANVAADGRAHALAVSTTTTVTQTVGNWQVTVMDLGLLPGGSMSSARAINNDVAGNKVVGMATDASFMLQRVVWDLTSGTITMLPNYDPSSTAEPESINDLGQVSGTERISSTLSTGVFWDANGAVFGLQPIAGGSTVQMTAHQINRGGHVVGSSREGAPNYRLHPVIWVGATSAPVSLGFLGNGAGGIAFGLNDAPHVVGEASTGTTSRGFLWRGDKLFDLGAVGGSANSSRAVAVNNVGVIAGTSDGGTIPVQWRYDPANNGSNPTLQRLPVPSGLVFATPAAINDAGDIVGSATLSNYAGTHAVLWRGGEAIDLGTWPGGRSSRAFGINRSGKIVGEGDLNGDGRNHALVWTVVRAGGSATPPPPQTNTAPSVSLVASGSTSLKVGDTLNAQGSFTDPDNGPWSYVIDWGDGTRSSGTRSAAGSFSNAHVYASTSPKSGFKVVLTVSDAAGASGSSSALSVRVSRK
jgi:probable HAF family extracellular repeat protein